MGKCSAVFYGGTERIVSFLTEELVRQGHEVTLFASGDSSTNARLLPMCAEALRSTKVVMNHEAPLTAMIEKLFGSAAEFDLIHSHLEFIPFPLQNGAEYRCSRHCMRGWTSPN